MIVPLWAKIAGAVGLLAVGGWTGYTINDAFRDSDDLAKLQASVEKMGKETDRLKTAGDKLEESRAAERPAQIERTHTVREIYKDNPVPADCVPDPRAVRVLDDAIGRANARVTGQPQVAVPGDKPAP